MDRKAPKRKPDRPMCRYGLSCYQKNPAHHKKYCHPIPASEKIHQWSKESCRSKGNANNFTSSSTSKETTSNETSEISKKVLHTNEKDDVETSTEQKPSSTSPKFFESVGDILKSMPKDFFDFWEFCLSLNKTNPEAAFAGMGLHLVGIYDLLARNLPKDEKILLHCHYRYYYDPPEFTTVVKADGNDLYHIGYFRDDPKEFPNMLASNNAAVGPELTKKGDNIFAAMNIELTERLPKLKSKLSNKFSKIQSQMQKYAEEKNYTLNSVTLKTKARQKKVVANTFHGLGIVVPVAKDVGYRPLLESNAKIKSILKRIINAPNEDKRLEEEEDLDEIITNVHFATDECDFGTALELGIDLFCYGDPYFHSHVLNILPMAYDLLNRSKYGEIVRCHLANRKKSAELNALDAQLE